MLSMLTVSCRDEVRILETFHLAYWVTNTQVTQKTTNNKPEKKQNIESGREKKATEINLLLRCETQKLHCMKNAFPIALLPKTDSVIEHHKDIVNEHSMWLISHI